MYQVMIKLRCNGVKIVEQGDVDELTRDQRISIMLRRVNRCSIDERNVTQR